jgi:putative FmdB family regulatory protein
MPTYEYQCKKCGIFEISQRITEDALKTCPTCSGAVERLISATAFHLKGGGWYKTDYASTSGSSASAPAPTTSTTESKPEATKSETVAPTPAPAVSTPTASGDS